MISVYKKKKPTNLLHSTSPKSKPPVFYNLFNLHVSLPFKPFLSLAADLIFSSPKEETVSSCCAVRSPAAVS